MTMHYRWLDETQTVILLELGKQWSWDEYLDAQDKLFAMIDTVDSFVDYLVDARESRSLPLGALTKLPAIFSKTHPRRGKSVIVGTSKAILTMWTLISRVIPQMRESRYQFVATMEEALVILERGQSEGQA